MTHHQSEDTFGLNKNNAASDRAPAKNEVASVFSRELGMNSIKDLLRLNRLVDSSSVLAQFKWEVPETLRWSGGIKSLLDENILSDLPNKWRPEVADHNSSSARLVRTVNKSSESEQAVDLNSTRQSQSNGKKTMRRGSSGRIAVPLKTVEAVEGVLSIRLALTGKLSSQRTLADELGCAEGTIGKCPSWKEWMKIRPDYRQVRPHFSAISGIHADGNSLRPDEIAIANEEKAARDDELQRLVEESNQDNRRNPGPLSKFTRSSARK